MFSVVLCAFPYSNVRAVILSTAREQFCKMPRPRAKEARLVSCLLYGTRFVIVKCISGGLHLKGFRRDVFLMTRETQTKASYHEFEKKIIEREIV